MIKCIIKLTHNQDNDTHQPRFFKNVNIKNVIKRFLYGGKGRRETNFKREQAENSILIRILESRRVN
jgi:hypothetical protein